MANAESVIVCCSLPNGLVCQVGDKRVTLRGSACYLQPNKDRKFKSIQQTDPSRVLYGPDTMTLVDKKFWDAYVELMGKDFKPITSGAIYWAKNKAEATLISKEREHKFQSGLAQLDPTKNGVKPAEDKPSDNVDIVQKFD